MPHTPTSSRTAATRLSARLSTGLPMGEGPSVPHKKDTRMADLREQRRGGALTREYGSAVVLAQRQQWEGCGARAAVAIRGLWPSPRPNALPC
eukprot:2765960-Prymnesium_polylepis.1